MSEHQSLSDREPVVSGRFYAKTKKELLEELADLFQQAEKASTFKLNSDEHIRALVSPHAGYLFSGKVAASAFRLLQGISSFKTIFLIGSSHHVLFNGASVYYDANYITPLGKVPVNEKVANELLLHNSAFTYHRHAHELEHSLEVQLPFLQYVLKTEYNIVPIILGSLDQDQAAETATILKPYFNNTDNLFVISTDLSHYPKYNDAVKIDKLTIDAITKNSVKDFAMTLANNDTKSVPGLSTSICGWTSILTTLNITQDDDKLNFRPILYQNSGDIPVYGNKNRVVGYQSMVITRSNS